MKQFDVKTITQTPEEIDGLLSYWGRITIGSFSERFVMPVDSWKLEQYKQQWKEGLKGFTQCRELFCAQEIVQWR